MNIKMTMNTYHKIITSIIFSLAIAFTSGCSGNSNCSSSVYQKPIAEQKAIISNIHSKNNHSNANSDAANKNQQLSWQKRNEVELAQKETTARINDDKNQQPYWQKRNEIEKDREHYKQKTTIHNYR